MCFLENARVPCRNCPMFTESRTFQIFRKRGGKSEKGRNFYGKSEKSDNWKRPFWKRRDPSLPGEIKKKRLLQVGRRRPERHETGPPPDPLRLPLLLILLLPLLLLSVLLLLLLLLLLLRARLTTNLDLRHSSVSISSSCMRE